MLQKKHPQKNLFQEKLLLKHPKNIAISTSLKYPDNLLIKVKKLNVPVDLIRFINHISLKFAPFVYLIT